DAGQVLIGSEDVTERPARARGVGMVFQHYAAFKHMTVYDNVAFGLTIRKRPRAEIGRRGHELLELVQPEGLAKRYPAQLCGSPRRRGGRRARPGPRPARAGAAHAGRGGAARARARPDRLRALEPGNRLQCGCHASGSAAIRLTSSGRLPAATSASVTFSSTA